METPNDMMNEDVIEHRSSTYVPPPASDLWSGLQRRVIAGLALAAVFLFATISGGVWFSLLILIGGLLMMREWDVLTEHMPKGWKSIGLAYVALPCASLIWLRSLHTVDSPNMGLPLVLYLAFVVWATDIGGFFVGKKIGGPKLAPTISPNKTWAGAAGGFAAAGIAGSLAATFTPYPETYGGALVLAFVLSFIAQIGDLFESWLKRRAGVKDSGELIPGHGGVLDRVDGFVAAAPLFALMVAFSGIAG